MRLAVGDIQRQIDQLDQQYYDNVDAQERLRGQAGEIYDQWQVEDLDELRSLSSKLAQDIRVAEGLEGAWDDLEEEQDRISDLTAELQQELD